MLLAPPPLLRHHREPLTWRAGVEGIRNTLTLPEPRQIMKWLFPICLNELEWEVWLRLDVHAHHFEASAVVTHRRPSGTAEQIKKTWLHDSPQPARPTERHSTQSAAPKGTARLASTR